MKWLTKLKSRASKYKGFSWIIKVLPIFYLCLMLIEYIEKGLLATDISNYIEMGDRLILYAPISLFIGSVFCMYNLLFITLLFIAGWLFDLCWRYMSILAYLAIHLLVRDYAMEWFNTIDTAILFIKANIFISSTLLFLIAELLIRTLLYEKVDRCANRTNSTE